MKIIAQTNVSREGNDCYIYESIVLGEEFGLYFVLSIEKVTGWSDYKSVNIVGQPTTTKKTAIKKFKEYGGVLNE